MDGPALSCQRSRLPRVRHTVICGVQTQQKLVVFSDLALKSGLQLVRIGA
jgi:hypothetical protein